MNLSKVKFDCKYFIGDFPCKPNKERNKICDSCDEYTPVSKRILIIKLGAIGDVIRTTPLVVKFKDLYPDCHISWLTHFPDILSKKNIDQIYKWNFTSAYILRNKKFDIAINLDKEFEACSLLNELQAEEKYGFSLKDNHMAPATPAAEHKLITGLYDSVSQANTKSYLEEIFEICHFKFNFEEYLLDVDPDFDSKWMKILGDKANGKKIIGLNTGCGNRWLTRLWPTEYWIELIQKLQQNDYCPVVLGGPDEDAQNKIYAEKTGCYYPGTYSLQEFIALTNNTDLIVTAVSMMMHIATGLKKPMILFVNIFNKNEFELYNRGEIISPSSGCDCYYGTSCSRERHCMRDISVEEVYGAIWRNL
ncbi:MAG: glycosyltransferase family 9 protein [Bacteroidetes bacterium]|nr:glycosyltransferase family 9 protein [Bacteroidota bacterium]